MMIERVCLVLDECESNNWENAYTMILKEMTRIIVEYETQIEMMKATIRRQQDDLEFLNGQMMYVDRNEYI